MDDAKAEALVDTLANRIKVTNVETLDYKVAIVLPKRLAEDLVETLSDILLEVKD